MGKRVVVVESVPSTGSRSNGSSSDNATTKKLCTRRSMEEECKAAANAARRILMLIPNAHRDIPDLLIKIASNNAEVATGAAFEMISILIGESETYEVYYNNHDGDATVQLIQDASKRVLVACGGHRAIAVAAKNNHKKDMCYQLEILSLLHMFSKKNASSLVDLGIMEHILSTMKEHDYYDEICSFGLDIIKDCIEERRRHPNNNSTNNIQDYQRMKVIPITVESMKTNFNKWDNAKREEWMDLAESLYAGNEVLRVMAGLPGANRSMFDEVKTLSLIASIIDEEKPMNRPSYEPTIMAILSLEC